MARVAIIVLNWNGAEDTIDCIDSLLSQDNQVPDIILVDNASSDNSLELLEKFIAQHDTSTIRLIKNTVNSGYAGGNNVGFNYALNEGYKYIGTLNPDAIADRNWVSALTNELFGYTDVGIATGTLVKSNKTQLDTTGEQYSTWGIPSPRGRDQPLSNAPAEAEYVFGSTGGGFIARADMLRDIGMFDENFFMYFEDVDFCFRAQLAGYKVRYTPKAVAYHKISASTNKVPGLATYNTFKNLPMLFFKNVPLGLWLTVWPRFTLAYTLILGNAIVSGRGLSALKGWLMSIVYLPHAFAERARIQANRRVTTAYISSIILHDIPPEQTGLRKFRKLFTGK